MNERVHRIKYVKILEMLRQESDEDRPLTTTYIIKKLKERGINIDRRTFCINPNRFLKTTYCEPKEREYK